MSRVVPQGTLEWTQSTSADVAGYKVYYSSDGDPTYDSPYVDVGTASEASLPLPGQAPAEGEITYGLTAYDAIGNESDIVTLTITLDTTPPAPPTDVTHTS